MKRVILLVLFVMLVSVFLTAADHPTGLLRLSIINKSGNEIYMRLQSETGNGGFYYLTIPAGTKDSPTVVDFTIVEDIYFRTTWYGPGNDVLCQGMMDTGRLIMDRNNRLVFLRCSSIPMRKVSMFDFGFDFDFDFDFDDLPFDFGMGDMIVPEVNVGEPSMEKVLFSGWQEVLKERYKEADDSDSLFDDLPFDFDFDDLPFEFELFSTSTPSLKMCQWRYQYSASEVEFLEIPPCQPDGCE